MSAVGRERLDPTQLAPVPVRRLVDEVVAPARRAARRLYLPAAVPLLVAGVAAGLGQLRWLEVLAGGAEDLGQIFTGLGVMLALGAVLVAVYGLAHAVLTVGAVDALAGRPVRGWAGWSFVLRPSFLGTWLAANLATGVAFLFCLVPGFYVYPVMAFVVPVMAEEGTAGMAAIRRAVQLAHHNPGRSWVEAPWVKMGVVAFVGFVVTNAVTLVVELPLVGLQQYLTIRQAAGGDVDPAAIVAETFWLQIAANVGAALLTAAAWIYASFAIAGLFREVRRRREGEDLEAAIAAVVETPA